jgi:CHAD domain-containing protein
MALDARRLKTGRAVRVSGASPGDAETSADPGFGRRAPLSTADYLRAYVAAQLVELRANEHAVRTFDDADAVHDMRVAVRRLRSVLRTAQPLLDRGWADALRAELERYGQLLGAVRDLDVLIERLGVEARELDAEADRLLPPLEKERNRARAELGAAMADRSYRMLLDAIESATRFLPVLRGKRTVEQLARKELKKLRRFKKRANLDDDRQLHKLRIRAKRARYAAELAESSRGSRATKFIEAAKKLQNTLGEHQDAVVALRRLRSLADNADSRTAFLAGRLSEREEQRKREARAEFPAEWKRVKKRGRAAW